MFSNKFKRISIVSALLLVFCIPFTGCLGQNDVAALLKVVGTSVSSIATIQGNADLAKKLNTDFNAASDAVSKWKQGDATQNVTQALNILQSDLNLIPVSDNVKIYIELAIATTNSILAIVTPEPTAIVFSTLRVTKPLVNAKEYKKAWNSLRAAHPSNVPELK